MTTNPQIKCTSIFINNEWRNSISGKTFPVVNPSTGEKIADVQEGDKADIDEAVKAARAAFKLGTQWRTMDASNRGVYLRKLADLITRDTEYLARLTTYENGKILNETTFEMILAVKTLIYYAGWCDKVHGKTIPADGEVFTFTRLEPLGVCGSITPWNYPFMLACMKIAPAVATGNVVVLKPPEQTPLGTLYLGELIKEAGFPPGVINIVPGYGPTAGAAISEHYDIDKVSFTGSVEVGKIIQQASGRTNLKKVCLELGGKSPLVIFPDVDINVAALTAHAAVFTSQGQVCCAGTRTYVHEDIYDQFIEKSKELALKRIVGDPYKPETQQGPQVNETQMKTVLNYIDIGKKEGAKLECGGGRIGAKGYFIQPTIFSNVTDNMKIAREEIFGPVMQVMKFKTMEEAIERSNDSTYGLAAGILTNDINKAITYSQGVRAGTIWVNTYLIGGCQSPFGGYKMSGIGRENGEECLMEYVEVKTVTIKIPQKNS